MKTYTGVTFCFLAIIVLVHLLRFALAWPVVVNGVAIPVWISLVTAVLIGGLAVMLWLERFR